MIEAQDPIEAAPTADAPSAGRLIRQARQAAGLSLDVLAASLKVPVRKLEALEAGRLEALPDGVFVRALASSVCRVLKVDPGPVLVHLPRPATSRSVPSGPVTVAAVHAPVASRRPRWEGSLPPVRPVVWVVIGLLAASAALWFLLPRVRHADAAFQPAVSEASSNSAPEAVSEVAVSNAAAAEPAAAFSRSDSPLSAEASSAQTAAQLEAVPTRAAAATGLAPSAAPAPEVVASAQKGAPAAMVLASAADIVAFKASGSSLVQVKDGTGTVLLRRVMEAGETAAASGPLPLSVMVGTPAAVDVQVRGQSFDLRPLVRDKVARFEVK